MKLPKTIIVTGTPGSGKTTLAKKISKRLSLYYFDVNKFISLEKIAEGYDKKRKSRIVDSKKLSRKIIEKIKQFEKNDMTKFCGIIIDSHLSHYLPKKHADFCIVSKCDIKELNKRLGKRGYPKKKIEENLQAEIFDICLNEAREAGHKIILADTTKDFNINKIIKKIGG